MSKNIYYTYLVKDISNNKLYIGSRKYNGSNVDQDNQYFGTPSKQNDYRRVIKETPYLLRKRVLKVFDTQKEALEHEIEIHAKYDVRNNPRFYNKANQTTVGFTFSTHTEESKKKMSVIQKRIGNKPPSVSTWWTKEHSKKQSERLRGNNYKKGKKESEETKQKKSISIKNSEKCKRHQKRIRTPEERAKISKANKGQNMGEKNPMSKQDNRDKVAQSKIGRKLLYHDTLPNRFVRPNTEIWNSLLSIGYSQKKN